MDKKIDDECYIIDKHIDNKFLNTLYNGLKSGLATTWTLAKIIIPVYFFITILKYTGVLQWISIKFAPIMGIFGLPGESAIAIVLGNCLNIYAAIGVLTSITLTTKQITIISLMLLFSHSLFLESAVAKKTGVSIVMVLIIRFSLAILSGIILNIIL